MIVLWGCLMGTTAIAGKLDRLSDTERVHWRALRVFVDTKDQKDWLKLKTEQERNQWLQDRGYWERFYRYPQHVRDQIVAGDVKKGWDRNKLYMAWGQPTERNRLTGRPASRSERLIYRFEVDKDGFITVLVDGRPDYKAVDRYQVDVVVDDDVVTELTRRDDWL
ncbi:MAG: hypothetical protein AAF602_20815 [Myxococcota bacterium]